MKNNSTTALPNQINKVFFDFQLSSSLEHFIRCSCDTADKPRLTIKVFAALHQGRVTTGALLHLPPVNKPGKQLEQTARLSNSSSPSAAARPGPPCPVAGELFPLPGSRHGQPRARAVPGAAHPQHPPYTLLAAGRANSLKDPRHHPKPQGQRPPALSVTSWGWSSLSPPPDRPQGPAGGSRWEPVSGPQRGAHPAPCLVLAPPSTPMPAGLHGHWRSSQLPAAGETLSSDGRTKCIRRC